MFSQRSTSPAYRCVLSGIALLLLALCSYLTLVLRAVPLRDLWVFLFAVSYGLAFSYFLPEATSRRPQPAVSSRPVPVQPLAARGRMFLQAILLLCTSFVLSIAIPTAWILLVPTVTESQIALLAPHLFCLSGQVFFELVCYRSSVDQLVRLAIPVLSTSYRFARLLDWMRAAEGVVAEAGGDVEQSDFFMLVLARVNVLFWALVLFYFLLLRVVPRYFSAPDRFSSRSPRKLAPSPPPPGRSGQASPGSSYGVEGLSTGYDKKAM